MIAWTFFSCVLLALSSRASASDSMEIGVDCDTSGKGGPDWEGMAKSVYSLLKQLPEVGTFVTAGENIKDFVDAVNNKDDGFAAQWKSCIDQWIDYKITAKAKSETFDVLVEMGIKMKDTIIPSIEDDYISENHFDKIKIEIGNLHEDANKISNYGAGESNPQAFLGAYAAALFNEIFASNLFIDKLTSTIYDPSYRASILHDLAETFSQRMEEYKDHLIIIDTVDFNMTTPNGVIPFWHDWNITHKNHGACNAPSNLFLSLVNYKCNVIDPTHRTGKDYTCGGFIKGCYRMGLYRGKHDCSPDGCKNWVSARQAMEANAKDNVRNILDGMKATAEKAKKDFDALKKPKALPLETDCHSGCRGSKYDVRCIKSCLLKPKEA